MKFSIDELLEIYEEQLFFELTSVDKERVLEYIKPEQYPNQSAYQNACLNWLCLDRFMSYIESEPDLQEKPVVWPSLENLPLVWSIVNGTALVFSKTRLVLIPIQDWDINELRVPREWIDVPAWASHGFVAMQVNLEDGWIQVWGYGTHQQFREVGQYDSLDETYSLPIEVITENLASLWVEKEYVESSYLATSDFPSIPEARVSALLAKLEQSSYYSPRLDYPFEQWGALISDPRWLQQLYHHCLHAQEVADEMLDSQVTDLVNDLGTWLHKNFQAGWQAFDNIFGRPSNNVAFAFRQARSNSRDILVERVKLIDLGVQLGYQSVALVVGITAIEQNRMGIQVQLLPTGHQNYLPFGVKLTLLSQVNKILQESTARYQDNLIQLKRFSCLEGKEFKVQVSLGEASVIEVFAVRPLVSPSSSQGDDC